MEADTFHFNSNFDVLHFNSNRGSLTFAPGAFNGANSFILLVYILFVYDVLFLLDLFIGSYFDNETALNFGSNNLKRFEATVFQSVLEKMAPFHQHKFVSIYNSIKMLDYEISLID